MTLYDTRDHQISGVSQQQGGRSTLTFTSQHGVVEVDTLPVVHPDPPESSMAVPEPDTNSAPSARVPPKTAAHETDVFTMLERLAELKQKGVLTEEEFVTKKAELLGRL